VDDVQLLLRVHVVLAHAPEKSLVPARGTVLLVDALALRVAPGHGYPAEEGLVVVSKDGLQAADAFEALDDLTQLLFIYENFGELLGQGARPPYFGRWGGKWDTIRRLKERFNKLTEELVESEALVRDSDPYIAELGRAFERYGQLLLQRNRVDFSHQQKVAWRLVQEPLVREQVAGSIRYVMVDEYQDTNYVQEQLMLDLSSLTGNLCVVGDEDQALYRFRGATVRNILEFAKHFPRAPLRSCRPTTALTRTSSPPTISGWPRRNGRTKPEDTTATTRLSRHLRLRSSTAIQHSFRIGAPQPATRLSASRISSCFSKNTTSLMTTIRLLYSMYSVQKRYSRPLHRRLGSTRHSCVLPTLRAPNFENEEVRLIGRLPCYGARLLRGRAG